MKGNKSYDPIKKLYRITYGRDIQKKFKSEEAADRFLTALRYMEDQGSLDKRDYASDKPLAFCNQAPEWLKKKANKSPSHYRNLERWMELAIDAWGDKNVKAITYGDLDDLIDSQPVGEKTKHEMANCFKQFFSWLHSREKIPMPDIPDYDYELGWREFTDIPTQTAIIEKVREIAPHRVWLGIKWLATYISIRPKEMMALREKDIRDGAIVCRGKTTKERKLKIVPMIEEDIALVEALPKTFPEMPFFRWEDDRPMYKRVLYYYWKEACKKLKITYPSSDMRPGAGSLSGVLTSLQCNLRPGL